IIHMSSHLYGLPLRLLYALISSSDAPLDLHSFPTRRSSDLRAEARPPFSFRTQRTPGYDAMAFGVSSVEPSSTTMTSSAGRVCRSEEHTSELQSLAYLVCRLLLEKKKDTIHVTNPLHLF